MDDAHATALESAIAGVGALLVQLQKYRAAQGEHAVLLRAALALGDRARADHHRQTLDPGVAGDLATQAASLHARAEAALATVRESPDLRAAATAHAAGDLATLRRLLPRIFVGLDAVDPPPEAFLAVPWLRRNSPRPPAELAAEVRRLRAEGLAAEGDPEVPGSEPALPAVTLAAERPAGDPLVLRFPSATLPRAVFRMTETDEMLVHVPRLRAPFEVIVPEDLDPDELGEISLDWPVYRAALVQALEHDGERVTS